MVDIKYFLLPDQKSNAKKIRLYLQKVNDNETDSTEEAK